MYYIYMIRCDDESLYTGITTDVERRMREHVLKLPQAAAYTKSREVLRLEALWSAKDRSSASRLEYRIKQLKKSEKEILIQNPDVFEGYSAEKIIHSDLQQLKSSQSHS